MWLSHDNICDRALVLRWEARPQMFRPVTDTFAFKMYRIENELSCACELITFFSSYLIRAVLKFDYRPAVNLTP
jgi:hypothetical protein